jgi:hypothetical protein
MEGIEVSRVGVFVCIGFWSNRLLEGRADKFSLSTLPIRLILFTLTLKMETACTSEMYKYPGAESASTVNHYGCIKSDFSCYLASYTLCWLACYI